jgi:hypothetical protein
MIYLRVARTLNPKFDAFSHVSDGEHRPFRVGRTVFEKEKAELLFAFLPNGTGPLDAAQVRNEA